MICSWDAYNSLNISEYTGTVVYEHLINGVTYREERDETSGHIERVVIESRDKSKTPVSS